VNYPEQPDDIQARIISNCRASGFIGSSERYLGITDNFAFAVVSEGEIDPWFPSLRAPRHFWSCENCGHKIEMMVDLRISAKTRPTEQTGLRPIALVA
jgi:hypothetical protein